MYLFQEVFLGFFIDPVQFFKHHNFISVPMRNFIHLPEESFPKQFSFNEVAGPEYPLILWLNPKRSGSTQVTGGIRRRRSKIGNIKNILPPFTEIVGDLNPLERKFNVLSQLFIKTQLF